MKKLSSLLIIIIVFIFFSCSSDDKQNTNEIIISASNFNLTIDENPINSQILGIIEANTNQGNLTYSIVEQLPNDAFQIDFSTGQLSVLDESLFDYETNPVITGIVKVENESIYENVNVTINLNNSEQYHKKSCYYYDGNIVSNREIYYNSSKKIDSIALNTSSRSITRKVNYTGNTVTSISLYYVYPSYTQEITYNVTVETNKITLVRVSHSDLTRIYFTNQFVDSLITNNSSKELFTRNSEQNLILRETLSNSTVIGNHTYVYSNFDSNNKNKPLGTRPMLNPPFTNASDLLDIFNLKVSKNNPLTLNINGNEFNFILDYDQNGFIEKSIRDNEQTFYRIEYQYIEL